MDGQSLRQVSAVQLLEATRFRHRDCLRNVLLKLKAWHLVETWTNVSYQMPTLTRVEFSTSRSLRSSRVVLLIEFPDEALERIRKEKASLEVEASHIAWQAIGAFKLGILRGDLNLISRTLSNERITPR